MISNEEAKQKVEDLFELGIDNFSSWEADFIGDVLDITEFTDDQLRKIEELAEKHLDNNNNKEDYENQMFDSRG